MEDGIDYNKIAANVITDIFTNVYDKTWDWFKNEAQARDFFGIAARSYCKEVWRIYNSIRVFGMSEDIPLEDLYVRINVLEKIQERYRDSVDYLQENYDFNSRQIEFGTKRETKSGIELINDPDNNKFIVLGKPGAGKTTYLKFLAINSIKKKSKIKNPKIPIFVSLKSLSDKNLSIIDFIEQHFKICSLEDPGLFINHILTKGKAIILLDGLDEVSENNKNNIIQQIIDFSNQFYKNTFVVSCRVAAYNWWFQKFVDVEVADFSDEQIEEFIKNWFKSEPSTATLCWNKLKIDAVRFPLDATNI